MRQRLLLWTRARLSVSLEDTARRATARKKESRKKGGNEHEEGEGACLLPLAPPSRTDTNDLFHARSTALTRHRYSVRRGSRESSPISIIRRFPVLLPPADPVATTLPRRRGNVDADGERDRPDVRADQSICTRASTGSLFRAVKFHGRLPSL